MRVDTDAAAEQVVDCLAELHSLTRLPRIGWVLAGVAQPESVSDHCFETALIAYLIARRAAEPVDLGKVLTMALFHEVGEVRLSDLPRRSAPYLGGETKRAGEREAALDVLDGVAAEIVSLLDELHELSTPEARIVEAAEQLQIGDDGHVLCERTPGRHGRVPA